MRTKTEIAQQIARMEVNALSPKFDAQMRSMFRKTIRSLKRELEAA